MAIAEASATFPYATRRAFQVRQTFAQTIAPENVARASATNCTGCHATAVAFQVVVASDVSTLLPSNLATATELSCTRCEVTALADQWVVASTGNRILLTPEGRIGLAEVHLQLLALTSREASGVDVTAAAAPLVAKVDDILAHDVAVMPPAGPRPSSPGAPGAPRANHNGIGDPPGGHRPRHLLDERAGRSVTVLPEHGYTVYFSTQVGVGGAAAPAASPAAPPTPGASEASPQPASPG